MSKRNFRLVRDIAIAVAIIVIFLQLIGPSIVIEHSMENTLHSHDYVFFAKQAYTFGDAHFGDIIVFRTALDDKHEGKKTLIKRIIGIPGDTVEIKSNAVYRNGVPLNEPYTKDGYTSGEMTKMIIPEGYYFVMGDNRAVSKDSRDPDVGLVSESNIRGKVIFRLFPLSDIGPIQKIQD
ncbi:MAG: signal peptidase I [Clostridiales Family XIII bacterium]|jgi:signal peptidase I|nr:signal peptidase I [Clostridiales Family XIII bacterium]